MSGKYAIVNIRLLLFTKRSWKTQALRENLSLSAWIRKTCERALDEDIFLGKEFVLVERDKVKSHTKFKEVL